MAKAHRQRTAGPPSRFLSAEVRMNSTAGIVRVESAARWFVMKDVSWALLYTTFRAQEAH